MKHLNLLKTTVLLITGLFANEVFGQAYITVESCDFTKKINGHNKYGDNWTYGSNWNIFGGANSSGNWAFIKLGANKANLQSPVFINNLSAISQDIEVVSVTANAGNLTTGSINSWALCVYSDSAHTNRIDSVVGKTMTKKTADTLSFIPSEGKSWGKNRFYKLTFDIANTTETNGIVWIEKIDFKITSTDVTAPTFTDGYPQTSNITWNGLDITVNADEPCTVYYMVLANESNEPTVTDIVNNNKTIAITTANTDFTKTISELSSETEYDIYLVAKDESGNTSEISKTEAKTAISTEPTINVKPLFKDKYCWGDTANIFWTTTNINEASDKDSIIVYKNGVQIYGYPIDITKKQANIVVGDGSQGNYDIYGTDYSLAIKNEKTTSAQTEKFTLFPFTNIKDILLNSNEYDGTIVRVKGLVTATKGTKSSGVNYLHLTLQDEPADSNAILANFCKNDTIQIGDSIFIEGKVSVSNGLTILGGTTSSNATAATVINEGNALPEATETSIADALVKDGNTCSFIKLTGVKYTDKGFTDGIDTIAYNSKLYSGNTKLTKDRKYDIAGIKGYNKAGQIWPRTNDDIYLYSNDTTLATFTINGQNALTADTILYNNLCKGIVVTTADINATFSVRVNLTNVDADDLANLELAENDSVIVTTVAEDGTAGKYKTVIIKDKTYLKFNTLATSEFGTGDTVSLTWTQLNIAEINIVLSLGGNNILLNSNPMQANSGKHQYVVPNSMFGQGVVKAIRVKDNATLDSLYISITDTKSPTATFLSPANGASQVAVNTYLTLHFDDAVKISENAIINIGDIKADLITLSDTSAKAFANGLKYGETYKITIPSGTITDVAGNDALIGDWKFTTKPAPAEDLYFSEYCEGAVGNNKYYEIYNPKATAVDLSDYIVMASTNGGEWKNRLQLSGTLSSESVFIAMNSKADTLTNLADILTTSTLTFNGDDALGLFKISGNDTMLIDIIGNYGEDPGTAWNVAGIKNATKDHVLVRKEIAGGTSDWTESAGTDSLDSQWIVLEDADYSNIGKHGIGHRTDILTFEFAGIKSDATINSDSATITIETLYGTDLTKLTPVFTLSRGAQLLINNKQVSSTTIDFSKPVKATVVAEDCLNTKDWTITVTTTAKLSDEAEILFFKFIEASAISTCIMSDEALIDILMPYGTNITELTPWFLISPNASVSSTTLKLENYQVSSTVTMDFSEPQTIVIYAEDKTMKTWTINVEVEQPLALTIHNIQSTKNDSSSYVNKLVTTEGIITSTYTNGKGTELYIQDSVGEWSGILVYDERSKFASKAKVGDKVSVTGVVTEYFNITEIANLKNFKTISENNPVEPMVLTAEDAKTEKFESVLVTINGLTCTNENGDTFAAEDETDSLSVYNKYKISEFKMYKDSIYNATGIMYYHSSSKTYEIIPRSLADIVNVTPIEPIDTIPIAVNETISAINIYAFNNTIVVENADADIYVFDIAGKAVAIRKNTSNRVEIKMPNSGLYIIRVGKEAQKVIIK